MTRGVEVRVGVRVAKGGEVRVGVRWGLRRLGVGG